MATVPTGLSGVPPSGPAIPVMPTPTPTRGAPPDAVGHRARHRLADRAMLGNERLSARPEARPSRRCCSTQRRGPRSPSFPERPSAAKPAALQCRTLPSRCGGLSRAAARPPPLRAAVRRRCTRSARARGTTPPRPGRGRHPPAARFAALAVRCSSIWPREARIVVVIGTGAVAQGRYTGCALGVDLGLRPACNLQHAPKQSGPSAPRRETLARRQPRSSASSRAAALATRRSPSSPARSTAPARPRSDCQSGPPRAARAPSVD